jgi:beta-carotene hydroxylase
VENSTRTPKPSIKELGFDLLQLSRLQLLATILVPFVFVILYFVFATLGIWAAAILCTIGLSFSTYGSTSHDLVHENLRIDKTLNLILLSVIELMCFRSGHAYKLSHLYHHKRFPHDDDVEGAASRMTFVRSLFEGIIFQFKIYYWALTHHRNHRLHNIIVIEGLLVVLMVAFCIYSISFTNVYWCYLCLMIIGSWVIPLVTSYAVHTPDGLGELNQTRLFRGRFFSIIAFNHLFHLEHHLYPMVPHKNWPALANRLNDFFEKQGIKPLKVKL